jgi:multidrug efflux system outer membrane protein
LDVDFQATHYRTSQSFASAAVNPVKLSPIQNFFQTGFDAIWQLDLFGKFRRSADAAYDLWEASTAEARAVKIVVLSEVANIYSAINAFQERITLTTEIIEIDRELLELAKTRFDAGLASEQEVQAAVAALEADDANLHLVQISFKLNMYSLATLLGRHPESLVADFREKRPIPYAVGRVPAGLPSDLLRRRPDIRAAERNLAAATEEVGVAVADLFPQVSLIGSSSSFAANPLQGANIGYTSDKFGTLFNSASRIWGVGGLVTFPVFDFGGRVAAVDVQDSLKQQAYLAYQKIVIGALQEVEQALAAYFNDESRVMNYRKEVEATHRIYELVADEFQAGLVDYSRVMEAKQAWIIALNTLTGSQQALATDLIAVYKALGGDW